MSSNGSSLRDMLKVVVKCLLPSNGFLQSQQARRHDAEY